MKQIVNQIVQFLQQGIEAIFKFVQYIWTWSFGQIISIFQSNWQALPIWKIVILAIVVLAIIYVLYKTAIRLWKAAEQILQSFIAALSVLVNILPLIVIAGLIAAAGGFIIKNVNF
ncbi:MAG: hypothetical protein GY927_22450 [bacterium]|nr:hypothetical protein [bacterium]